MDQRQLQQPQGCLFSILKLFGLLLGEQKSKSPLPYRLRERFLSPAELSFYKVLQQAVPDHILVCPKVNLQDLFFVRRSKESISYLNKINRKHVDFVLCNAALIKPVMAIELDDASHSRKDRQARDAFVDEVFAAADLPLLHVRAARSYQVSELAEMICSHLSQTEEKSIREIATDDSGTPVCPQCETSMILRTASRGKRKGEAFWGCTNYPDCREIVPANGEA